MQYFIDSSKGFHKLLEIGNKLDTNRQFCKHNYFDYPSDYSVTDEIVYFCYSLVCELSLVENYSFTDPLITIHPFDLKFLDNMLGDHLEASFFTEEFVKTFIEKKLDEYSRVLIPDPPYFVCLCSAYDSNKKANFIRPMCQTIDALADAYVAGAYAENKIKIGFDAYDEACSKQMSKLVIAINEIPKSPQKAVDSLNAYELEMAEFFNRAPIEHTGGFTSSKANPITIGSPGIIESGLGKTEITVKYTVRGTAARRILDKDAHFKYVQKPEMQQEYLVVLIHVKVVPIKCNSAYAFQDDFYLVSQDGSVYGVPIADDVNREFYGGTEQECTLVYIVDEYDQPLICFGSLWFSMEQKAKKPNNKAKTSGLRGRH